MEINFEDFRDSEFFEKLKDVKVQASFDGMHSKIILKGDKTLIKILVASMIKNMAYIDGVDTEEIIEELRDNIQNIVLNRVKRMGEKE